MWRAHYVIDEFLFWMVLIWRGYKKVSAPSIWNTFEAYRAIGILPPPVPSVVIACGPQDLKSMYGIWCMSVLLRGGIAHCIPPRTMHFSSMICPMRAASGLCVRVAFAFILSATPFYECPGQAMPPFMPLLALKTLQRNGHSCFSCDEILELLGFYIGCNEVDKRRV